MRRRTAHLGRHVWTLLLFTAAAAAAQDHAFSAVIPLDGGWLAAGTQNVASGTELLLARDDGETVTFLPVPSARSGRLRANPVPLVVAGGELAALAWLEGNDLRSLGVRFARWDGERWSTPHAVAAPGPGSQIALTAMTLSDGSWLLAWSRFDGNDDEIVWTRSRGPEADSWTAPRRIAADNAVPDITPALVATHDGALAVWSRYDGENYRLVTARFDGRTWSTPRTVGPVGSVDPSWTATAGNALLLARTAVPRGWIALEVDATGRAQRRAAVEAAGAERPTVDLSPAGATFRWLSLEDQVTVPWTKLR
jgi:hypothetical protein